MPHKATHLPTHDDPPGRGAGDSPNDSDPRDLRLHRPPHDVPYVPTDMPVVQAMLTMANVGVGDVLYDLGCGDGRIVIEAARRGARAVGVEIDLRRLHECHDNARNAGLGDRARFLRRSFFDVDLREATVVTLYLLPAVNVKLRPKLLWELRPGARIIANYFGLGDWQPDVRAEVHHRILYEWIVPAWVAGDWACVLNAPPERGGRQRMILRLRRHYQVVAGTARIAGREVPVANGRLFGDRLTFKLPDPGHNLPASRFECRVDGDRLRGTCQADWDDAPAAWGGIHR